MFDTLSWLAVSFSLVDAVLRYYSGTKIILFHLLDLSKKAVITVSEHEIPFNLKAISQQIIIENFQTLGSAS
jgi:hypothetical protein